MIGFQKEAFDELERHRGDVDYEYASLVIDGMSIKEQVEFNPHLGYTFGLVDYGGKQDLGSSDTPANEVLVALLVGYKKYWKLPIGYFFVIQW